MGVGNENNEKKNTLSIQTTRCGLITIKFDRLGSVVVVVAFKNHKLFSNKRPLRCSVDGGLEENEKI
jgi:hypothetical protein